MILPSDVDSDLNPRLNVVRTTLKECSRLLEEECDTQLQDLEKRFKDVTQQQPTSARGSASGSGSARGSARGRRKISDNQGNFGTFEDEDE